MDLNSGLREKLSKQIDIKRSHIAQLRQIRDQQVRIFDEREAERPRNNRLDTTNIVHLNQNYQRSVNELQEVNQILRNLHELSNAEDRNRNQRERIERNIVENQPQRDQAPIINSIQNREQPRQQQIVLNRQNHEVRNGVVEIILENPVQNGVQNNHEVPIENAQQIIQEEAQGQDAPQNQRQEIALENGSNRHQSNMEQQNFDESSSEDQFPEHQIYRDYPEDMQNHPREYVMQKFGTLRRRYEKYVQTRRHGMVIPENAYYVYHFYKKINFSEFRQYNWSNIWQLNVVGCQINDDGFAALIEGRNSYLNLVAVMLSKNDIRTVTREMLRQLPRLVYINFGVQRDSNPNLTPQSILQLQRYRILNPHKRIKFYRQFILQNPNQQL